MGRKSPVAWRPGAAIAAGGPIQAPPAEHHDGRIAREKMTTGIVTWIAGEGPAHIANTFATGTQKNRITITELAKLAKAKRQARRDFMTEY